MPSRLLAVMRKISPAEGDDGQVVAAQPQGGRADQDAEDQGGGRADQDGGPEGQVRSKVEDLGEPETMEARCRRRRRGRRT